jgi:hypothetical protein
MSRIALVGCGFLGSLFAEEMAKRQFAFDDTTEWVLIDFDKVEERNAANQNFTLDDEDRFKIDAVHDRLSAHGLIVDRHPKRLDKLNIGALLDDAKIIVSAVDNLPTRELLWYHARARRLPILHLGVSQGGTGNVEWTYGRYDTWSMSPILTLGQKKKMESAENIPRELKPCELIAFRGLGLNVSVAAAKALGIFMGFDPEKVVNERLGVDVLPGTVTTWSATNTGHQLIEIKELNEEELFRATA